MTDQIEQWRQVPEYEGRYDVSNHGVGSGQEVGHFIGQDESGIWLPSEGILQPSIHQGRQGCAGRWKLVAQRRDLATGEEARGEVRVQRGVQVVGDAVGLAGLARCARYDFPLIFRMMAPSTTRSRNAVASGGSPR